MKNDAGGPVSLLLRKMTEAQARNNRLSQRAFATRLGLSSGAFSEILQGKRALSHQAKLKIAQKLQLSPREEQIFFENSGATVESSRAAGETLQLSTDQFHLISDWWHFAILNLVRTRGFKPQLAWLAKRVGLPTAVISDAWDRLFRLGFLEKTPGGVKRKHPSLAAGDGLFDLSIQKSHLEDLKLIERSLMDIPLESRDHTSLTLTINKKDLPRAKEMIRIFRDHFESRVEAETGDDVYRLSIAFYPLTCLEKGH